MFEERVYEIMTLTHFHIGAGESLQASIDFVIQGGKVIVLNQGALADIINEKGYLKDFTEKMLALKGRFELNRYLAEKHLNTDEILERTKAYTLDLNLGRTGVTTPIREIKAFIKTAGRPYIPGASVKGALRVAFLYNLLKRLDPEPRNRFFKRILETNEESRLKKQRSKKEVGKAIDEILLSLTLPGIKGNEPHSDIFRVLRVSDSEPLDPSVLEVIPVKVLTGNGSKTKAVEFVEALKPGVTFKVKLWIDKGLLEWFKVHNPHGIRYKGLEIDFEYFEKFFERPFAFSKAMIDDYMQGLKDKIPSLGEHSANLRLGWGKGQIASTVFNLLPDDLKLYVRRRYFGQNTLIPISKKTFNSELLGFCLARRLKLKTERSP